MARAVHFLLVLIPFVTPPAALSEGLEIKELRDLRILDAAGVRHHLGSDPNRKGTAIIFLSTECPICQQYIPELNRIASELHPKGIQTWGVLCDPDYSRKTAKEFQDSYRVHFPLLLDETREIAAHLKPTHMPEAFLLDDRERVVYRGRIDDRYPDVGKRRSELTSRDLLDAATALLAGEPIRHSRTAPVGCKIGAPSAVAETTVTFSEHIAPILYANCTECHREGAVAPFPLISYEDAAKRADWIAEVVGREIMPPWKAAEGHGQFIAERRLSKRQRELLSQWASAGAPRGESAAMPPLPDFPEGWSLGEPDLVIEAPHSVTVPAEGPDIFHHFVIPIELDADQAVAAVEFRPGNPRVVHHAVILLDTTGSARKRDERTPEPGYTTSGGVGAPLAGILNVWAPGVSPRFLPDGVGMKLPKESDLLVQLHLHPSGKEETDRSKLGIYLTKKPVSRYIMNNPFIFGPIAIDIPAGAQDFEVRAKVTLPVNLTLTAILPHMHLIGREMKVDARLPDGTEMPLIWIQDWDFNWQDQYLYREPVQLPRGTEISVVGRYDNTADNPANPHQPPQRMLFGEETEDEMCLAVFQAIADSPGDSREVRKSVFRNVLNQISDPSVHPDAREQVMRQIREFAGTELMAALRSRATGQKPSREQLTSQAQ